MTQNPPEQSDPQIPAPETGSTSPAEPPSAAQTPAAQTPWVPPAEPEPAASLPAYGQQPAGQVPQAGWPHGSGQGWPPAHPVPAPAPPGWGVTGAQRPWPGHVPQGPRPVAYPAPVRFEPVPVEGFGLAILPSPRTLNGVAVGSLVTGIGSILVSTAVWCFGLTGAGGGWGGLVAGAFFVLSALAGIAGVALGVLSLRQIKRGARTGATGRGYGVSGVICGGFGLLSAALGLLVAIQLSSGA